MQMAAALKALDIIQSEPGLRDQLWRNVRKLRDGINSLGFDTLGSQTPIVPVLIGPDDLTMLFWKALWEEGVFTTPALPPGVPQGQSIIRTSVNANHTDEQLDILLSAFEAVGRRFGMVG